jgi:hypothetical protein
LEKWRSNFSKTPKYQKMKTQVECYAGYSYPERPLALWWQGRRLEVASIRAEGRTPAGKWFRIETGDERVFEMNYDQAADEWQVTEVS